MNRTMTLRFFSAGAAGVFAFLSATSALQAQEYVIRDRVAEARERIVGSQNQEMPIRLVVPAPSNPAAIARDIADARIQASAAMYVTNAPVPQYEESEPQRYRQEAYASSVMQPRANDPFPRYVFDQDPMQISNDPPKVAGAWASQMTPGVVWSNTHLHEGMSGQGQVLPFAYSSAYARSGFGQTHDAVGNPLQCDDWRSSCQCSCCDEPVGLACFRPNGHFQKLMGHCGHCGKHGCKGCNDGQSLGSASSCGCGCGK